jgi:hypothetical protein
MTTSFWHSKQDKPLTRQQVSDKMIEAIDTAVMLACEAGVPATQIADALEQRAEVLRQQDAISRPIGY